MRHPSLSVKQFETIVIVAFGFLMLSTIADAQIEDFYNNMTISPSGKTTVSMEIFPSLATDTVRFSFRGAMQNFNSNADCSLQSGTFSFVDCKVRGVNKITISFETSSFMTGVSQNRFYFASNFDINQKIDNLYSSVSLPDGMILIDKNQTQFSYVVYPDNPEISSDGRKLVLNWQMKNVTSNNLRFEVLYEQSAASPLFQIQLRYFVLAGAAFAMVFGFIYLRYFKKTEKVVLSVLDEYERRVIDILLASDSPLNQRKVVQETNFSKAKVSRVVKNLADRGLLQVERRGRTNILKVLRKKLQV